MHGSNRMGAIALSTLLVAIAAWSCSPSVDLQATSTTGAGTSSSSGGTGACPDGLGDCYGNGCDIDLGQDPLNCGACDVSCAEGGCNAGVCSPPPEVLAKYDGDIGGPALDDDAVYWSQGNTLLRRAKGGGDPSVVTTTPSGPQRLAVDGTHVYWTEPSTGSVGRAPKMGGPAEIVAAGEAKPFGLALDADAVYWTTITGNAIRRRAKVGGSPKTLTDLASNCTDLALDADAAYWSNAIGGGGMGRIPKAGGAAATLFPVEGIPGSLAVDGASVYVWVADPSTASWPGQPRRVAKAGGATSVLAPFDKHGDGRLTVDATHVYWCTSSAGNTLKKVPKEGGVPVSLASGNYQCGAIAVDATHVYWSDIGENRVLRSPK